jgi:NADPH:quinone reductase-like Zn-dependent oxidoreductase
VHRVLVRVRGVSCNYRDRAFIRMMQSVATDRCSGVGSEFVGEVIDVGAGVTTLRAGDRVIPDHHYPGLVLGPDGARPGIPTNQASRPWQVLYASKLARIPAEMSDEEAAAYSMTRKLNPSSGGHALVFAASSNTSLFAIGALLARGAIVHAATTSPSCEARLLALGVSETICVPRGTSADREFGALVNAAAAVGGFEAIVDPYFDLHLATAVQLLRPFGRYVTCGLAAQNPHLRREAGLDGPIDLTPAMLRVMDNNLSLIGNCLGLHEDLAAALDDFGRGRARPIIDSVFEREQAGPFFDRTYNARGRFGKVVFRYES